MTNFRVRIKTASEVLGKLPPGSAIWIPCGMDPDAWRRLECHDILPPRAFLVANQTRQLIEHDRKCDLIARARRSQ